MGGGRVGFTRATVQGGSGVRVPPGPTVRSVQSTPPPPVPQLILTPHLEVPVDDAHIVQVLDSIQHLEDEAAGIPLCVEAFFHNAVKQFPSRHPAAGNRAVWLREWGTQGCSGGGGREGCEEGVQVGPLTAA